MLLSWIAQLYGTSINDLGMGWSKSRNKDNFCSAYQCKPSAFAVHLRCTGSVQLMRHYVLRAEVSFEVQ